MPVYTEKKKMQVLSFYKCFLSHHLSFFVVRTHKTVCHLVSVFSFQVSLCSAHTCTQASFCLLLCLHTSKFRNLKSSLFRHCPSLLCVHTSEFRHVRLALPWQVGPPPHHFLVNSLRKIPTFRLTCVRTTCGRWGWINVVTKNLTKSTNM